ncbi:MAG: 50S ribosomal protein L4 [Candidatus Obscuribacterales bacterium]|nr:50S ribosomal protein L4 [Candidatus Obscuribacterales bacterium]
MTSAQVVDLKGKKLHEVGLDDDVFGITPNEHVMHQALVRQLANGRSGSANTKTRAEVRGGGKKPWRQKGTGRARAGSIRSPLWEGGGVAFGPKPKDFSKSMPKKVRVLAIKSALASKREDLVIVSNFDDIKGKTKEFSSALKQLNIAEQKVVLVLDYKHDGAKLVERSARNIEDVVVISVLNLNVKDLLHAHKVLMTEGTLEAVNNRFKAALKEDTTEAAPKASKAAKATAEAKKTKPAAEKAPVKKEAAPKAEKAEKAPKAEKAEKKEPAKKAPKKAE